MDLRFGIYAFRITEVAVDAREIKHLFDGDEKKARLFMLASFGKPWPNMVREIIDYVQELATAKSRSAVKDFVGALSLDRPTVVGTN